jgi:hypothetical protein
MQTYNNNHGHTSALMFISSARSEVFIMSTTSATSAMSLPKSKTYASSPSESAHATAMIRSDEAAAHRHTEREIKAVENPDFTHPDHVVPLPKYEEFQDLIIVCCHAIFLPDAGSDSFPLHSPHDERNWLLAPFQKSNTMTGTSACNTSFRCYGGSNNLTNHRLSA